MIFKTKKILYRANNIEHEYYEGLAKVEKNLLKKLYLKWEARKLARYEWQLKHADVILSVAKQDIPHYERYGKTLHIPPFFDDTHTSDLYTKPAEKFVLYQGNLAVQENANASEYIIKNIAPLTDYKIIIAGKSPSPALKGLAASVTNVELIDTPSHEEMARLIRDAQVNLLLTFQQTGVKLKLLHAIQSGRHILINPLMDDDGIFSEMCEVAVHPKEFAEKIEQLMNEEFTSEMKTTRDAKFNAIYSNKKKAADILSLI
jgi:hypothetical protein